MLRLYLLPLSILNWRVESRELRETVEDEEESCACQIVPIDGN